MLSHADLVTLVERLMAGTEEDEAEAILDQLREQLPHPALAELIYWPEQVPGFPYAEPTAEQVVAFAAAYRPCPLSEVELTEMLSRWIDQEDRPGLAVEDVYRLADTVPKFDWESAVNWARFQKWSGAELGARIRSGELERDVDYQGWHSDVFEADVE
jgi:hypothetical protein